MQECLKKLAYVLLNSTLDPVKELDMERDEIEKYQDNRIELIAYVLKGLGCID